MDEVVGSIPTGSTNQTSQSFPRSPRLGINTGFLRDFSSTSVPDCHLTPSIGGGKPDFRQPCYPPNAHCYRDTKNQASREALQASRRQDTTSRPTPPNEPSLL